MDSLMGFARSSRRAPVDSAMASNWSSIRLRTEGVDWREDFAGKDRRCAVSTPGSYGSALSRSYPAAEAGPAGAYGPRLWNLRHEWYSWGGRGGSVAKRPSYQEMDRQLRDARSRPLPGWEWLAQLPAQASQQVLRHYLRAWERCFKGLSGPPRFKHRTSRMAVDVPQAADLRVVHVNRRWGEVTVLLVGRVRFRWTRPLPVTAEATQGRITGARLLKDPLGWHICFRIHEAVAAVEPREDPAIGVDLGVVHTIALSDGRNLDMPGLLRRGEARRLRALQHRAARRRERRGVASRSPSESARRTVGSPRCGLARPVDVRTGSTRPRPRSLRATARSWSRT